MKKTEMNRRDFTRLTSAALGGMVAGAMVGCNGTETADPGKDKGKGKGKDDDEDTAPPEDTADAGHDEDGEGHDEEHHDDDHDAAAGPHLLIEGKNVCRGLNHTCAGHKEGDNKCAGQGACATATAHTCHGANDCRGEGGCGAKPGQNACKAKGECGVPLGDKAWAKARPAFEAEMNEHDKKFGDAPAKPTS